MIRQSKDPSLRSEREMLLWAGVGKRGGESRPFSPPQYTKFIVIPTRNEEESQAARNKNHLFQLFHCTS